MTIDDPIADIPEGFEASLPQEPAHRSLGAALFEADGQGRDHRAAGWQKPHTNGNGPDPRRADRRARRQRDGL
mgnify:CR=1 FL=1